MYSSNSLLFILFICKTLVVIFLSFCFFHFRLIACSFCLQKEIVEDKINKQEREEEDNEEWAISGASHGKDVIDEINAEEGVDEANAEEGVNDVCRVNGVVANA